MRSRGARAVLVRLLLGAGVLALRTPVAAACDPSWLPIARPPGIAYFVAAPDGVVAGGARAQLLAGGGPPEAGTPGSVALVPWSYRPDCAPRPWSNGDTWPLPSQPAFYTGWLRPREGWIDGLPTFDVHMAWREPLWQGGEPRWKRAAPDEMLLSPREFLQLYAALPTTEELDRDPRAAAERLGRWASEHPSLASREPARTILGNLARAAQVREPRGHAGP